MKIVAGDIGATKTRLGLFNVNEGAISTIEERQYSSRDFAQFGQIIGTFLDQVGNACDAISIGIAGPVSNGECVTTNLPWRISAQQIADDYQVNQVFLLNDLEATAWGLGALEKKDFHTLNQGEPANGGNRAIIAAGTGLGQAGLFWDGKQYRPFASEGGHCDFAPGNALEIELLLYLGERYDHVSWERIVSGMGLVNLYQFLLHHRKARQPGWLRDEMEQGDSAAAISRAALAERCAICIETIDLFIHLYGVEAGNQALKVMATGGVYIGGGIAPKLLESITSPRFFQGFCSKGRMKPLMASIPIKIILNDKAALYGPALFAEESSIHT